jgi:hypothetical protein
MIKLIKLSSAKKTENSYSFMCKTLIELKKLKNQFSTKFAVKAAAYFPQK